MKALKCHAVNVRPVNKLLLLALHFYCLSLSLAIHLNIVFQSFLVLSNPLHSSSPKVYLKYDNSFIGKTERCEPVSIRWCGP